MTNPDRVTLAGVRDLIVTDLRYHSPSQIPPLTERIEHRIGNEIPSPKLTAALRQLRQARLIIGERSPDGDTFQYSLTEDGSRRYEELVVSAGRQASQKVVIPPTLIPGT